MFVDEKELLIRAGKGGDGVALFRREIYVPRGGPDGGDGGKGGDVHIVGKNNLHALTHLTSTDRILAEDGKKGGHKTSTGKSGEDSSIEVPLGTIVEVKDESGTWRPVTELVHENDSYLIAKGGNGGWGNWHFKSSINQAPERYNEGLPGEEKQIRLILKLIADVGLIGLPNAGKSTFLSVVSAARPKIANYPFTTLEPQLGVAEITHGKETATLVIADLPGLIEGASNGKGLGSTFLKHVERTKVLLHMLDASGDLEEIMENYRTIRKELEGWSETLAGKTEIITLTKIDTILPEEAEEKRKAVAKEFKKPVASISAATHKGVKELLTSLL